MSVPASVSGSGARYTTSAERQELMNLMLSTLHVEVEINIDRNIDLLNALKLRNHMSN